MKNTIATIMLVLFTLILAGWTYAKYEVFKLADCHMNQTGELAGFCRAYLEYQPSIIFWRSMAIEALALAAYLLALRYDRQAGTSE